MIDSASDPGRNGGGRLTQPVRDILAALSSALHTRLDLLILEAHEELERSKQSLAFFLILIVSVALGFVLFNVFLVAVFWQNGWIPAIGLLSLIYFGVAALAAVKFRASRVRSGGLFAATLAEIGKDRERIKGIGHEP